MQNCFVYEPDVVVVMDASVIDKGVDIAAGIHRDSILVLNTHKKSDVERYSALGFAKVYHTDGTGIAQANIGMGIPRTVLGGFACGPFSPGCVSPPAHGGAPTVSRTDNSLPGRQTKDSPAPIYGPVPIIQNARPAQRIEWAGHFWIQSSQPESGWGSRWALNREPSSLGGPFRATR